MFLLVASYILVYISAMILRKRIPGSEYKFKIPGGYPFLVVLCIVPITVAVISFFINGTDYFIGGMLGLVSGPILYVICKKRYGGLAKKGHPANPRTGLANGDLKRIAGIFFGLAIVGFIAIPWLRWFEGSWAEEYYLETYGSGFLSSFGSMLTGILVAALISLAIAIIAAWKLEPKKGSQTAE